MLKKLTNLLFEDEEIEVDELGEETPVVTTTAEPKPAPVQTQETTQIPMSEPRVPAEEPVVQKPQMQRIDVTQTFETPIKDTVQIGANQQQAPVFKQDVSIPHADPRPVEQTTPVEEKPNGLGLTVDELDASKAAQPAETQQKANKKPSSYEFPPVISPIFGVDDKDLDAVQTSGKAGRPAPGKEENVSKVISPMYGMDQTAAPTSIQTTVEDSNRYEEMNINTERKQAEDEIPEFSLDDILKVRDEEFMDNFNEPIVSTQQSLFSDEIVTGQEPVIDQTLVFDTTDVPSLKGNE